MKLPSVRTEERDGSTFIVAEGPSPTDIGCELHERLVSGINGKIDIAADVMMAFSRDVEGKTRRALIDLGWAPPETRTQAVAALADAVEAAIRKGVTVQWEPLAAALVAAHDALANPK